MPYSNPYALHEELLVFLRDTSKGISSFTRNEYLENFRNYIGSNIYLSRVPLGAEASNTCVITPIAIDRDYYCSGESNLAHSTIQIDIYSSDWDASQRARFLHDNLRLAMSSYLGTIGNVFIKNSEITRESLSSTDPVGGDDSEFRYSSDWVFAYDQLAASTLA